MNARCKTARARSLLSRPESIGDPFNNNGFEFSTSFLHLFRQSALLKSHFVKSSDVGPLSRPSATATGFRNFHLRALLQPLKGFPVTLSEFSPSRPATATGFPVTLGISTFTPFCNRYRFPCNPLGISKENRTHIHQAHSFQCRLSFHCCCSYCCCPRLGLLQDAPFASSVLPVVRRFHRSFRSPVPNSILQVAVVQVAVAQAVAQAATPNRCYCCFLPGCCFEHSMLMAPDAAPSPSGWCLLR